MKKYLIVFLLAATTSWTAVAQKFEFQFDHQSIVVKDVNISAAFYGKILGLKETAHPDNPPTIRWFVVNGNSHVHLIQRDFVPFEKSKSMHLCLSTQDLDGVISHLEENNITYWDWPGEKNAVTTRADKVRQIYIQDPDEYWIEINTAKH